MNSQRQIINIPLQQWIKDEEVRVWAAEAGFSDNHHNETILKKQSLLRKTSVSYTIARLIQHKHQQEERQYQQHQQQNGISISIDDNNSISPPPTTKQCIDITNFSVHTRPPHNIGNWIEDVRGVSMSNPELSAEISEPFFLVQGTQIDRWGRYLEIDISSSSSSPTAAAAIGNLDYKSVSSESTNRKRSAENNTDECRLFGNLLYELYSGSPPINTDENGEQYQPATKKSIVRYDKRKGKSYSTLQVTSNKLLQELGYPSSISILVQHLMDGHEYYPTLDAAIDDLHLLVNDPECFLFDQEEFPTGSHQGGERPRSGSISSGNMPLQIKEGRLYGREKEVSLITDSFCRVSEEGEGTNEAFFIGGYSGSGKSMLVHSITARVDIAGGYVLQHKVDQMSRDSRILNVVSVFNELCLLIKKKSSERQLQEISRKLGDEFESADFANLARLIPNVTHICSIMSRQGNIDSLSNGLMNLSNVCFTLQRFMRIVSSKETPVVLFMDDIHWAGSTSLELIQSLLCDTRGGCLMFIGSYRDNEVTKDHPMFQMMKSVRLCGVVTTELHLKGLNKDDLNQFVAEMLGILPRICKPLSDIIYKKTEGNPYFALAFVRSLVDKRLLKYSLREKRWIWDEDKIKAEQITDNVLHLLSSRMTSFPEETQIALKILACFGIKVNDSVIKCLSTTPTYTNLQEWINQCIDEGLIKHLANQYHFVHDKVREAAYSLIPESSKKQFHYDLGMLLHSAMKGQDMGSVIFLVVNQINHGSPALIQSSMKVDISELNYMAGSRAMSLQDNQTANSYLTVALSLLPENHWTDHYELSLKMYILAANVAYTCGNTKQACLLLKKVISEKRPSLENKLLDAYVLYATILHTCDQSDESYDICVDVLTQLNETLPSSSSPPQELVETAMLLAKLSNNDITNLQRMPGGSSYQYIMKFYNLLLTICYLKMPQMMVGIGCRMIRITLDHGLCSESILGFVQYCGIICMQAQSSASMKEAYRIGKTVMQLLQEFTMSSPEILPNANCVYYGFIAPWFEQLQMCTANLRKSFEAGLSCGVDANLAFNNSIFILRNSLLGGDNLVNLLKEADHHLEITRRFNINLSMPILLAYRETISVLIDKGQSSTGMEEDIQESNNNPHHEQHHSLQKNLNKVLQTFWSGYTSRCKYFVTKVLEDRRLGPMNKDLVLFYAAINSFRGVKNSNASQFQKFKPLYDDALTALRASVLLNPTQINKVHLLEAELCSFQRRDNLALQKYNEAIRASTYIHELGLAYESAGLHLKKSRNVVEALSYFHQAKECYTRWGSQMKVESIVEQINRLTK